MKVMQGAKSLAAVTLALLLVFSVLGNSNSAPQRLFERRNWTPQAMLYLKGAQGRRFISDQSRRKDLSDRLPPERRSPNPQLLSLPEAAALLLALLQKPQEGDELEAQKDQVASPPSQKMEEKTSIKADSWAKVC